MIDHTGVVVSDLQKSRRFYEAALVTLNYACLREVPGGVAVGFGEPPKPDFWLAGGTPNEPRVHIAFRAKDRATVDAFYRAAIAAGGRDNGGPGPRPHYH